MAASLAKDHRKCIGGEIKSSVSAVPPGKAAGQPQNTNRIRNRMGMRVYEAEEVLLAADLYVKVWFPNDASCEELAHSTATINCTRAIVVGNMDAGTEALADFIRGSKL